VDIRVWTHWVRNVGGYTTECGIACKMKRLSSIFINTADNLKLIIVSTEFGRAEVVNDALECVWMTARFTVIVV